MTDEGDNGRTLTCNVCGCTARNVCLHVAEGRQDMLEENARLRGEQSRFKEYLARSAIEFRLLRTEMKVAQSTAADLEEDVRRLMDKCAGVESSKEEWRKVAYHEMRQNVLLGDDLRVFRTRIEHLETKLEAIRAEMRSMRSNVREANDYGDGALLDEARTDAIEAIDDVLKGV